MAEFPKIDDKASREELYDYALEIACDYDTSSPRDRSVFFSSGQKTEATRYCQKMGDGHLTVCMTPALIAFDRLNLFRRGDFHYTEIFEFGDVISKRFADEASGNVTAFVGAKSKATGTFRRVELPALLVNPNVLTINEEPKENYLSMLTPEQRFTLESQLNNAGLNSSPEI